ncbi:branched-chain amino acid ABC transporter permease [Tuanshanicoccus lijuaniae]|uniref:branched-chain amino acid ABC transporter permease n=1 Tax=Aerococcaceae bacterium zg-1292 TaxID=2774330 RepID=UPI001BD8D382|nr:branched-chain amino acid ABC transporter permease [Aerococcaceae bacterium zg-BR22]MBS4455513.1 branched-chain amino acid ABC transporter permease [Aerococcaceae bacterium zg-A91]MBS4457132.1 branched-chain amino acid ABC transporter permease [Aerococcaceae bacterium zg-BR33]
MGLFLNNKNKNLLLVVIVIMLCLLPMLQINLYNMNILIRIYLYTIMALGLNILVGFTGIVSLGQAAFVAIGAYGTTILMMKASFNFFVAIVISALFAGMIGLLLGFASLRVNATYLTIVTLGFGEIIRTVIIVWENVTNGPLGIRNIPAPNIFGFEFNINNNGLYYLVLGATIFVIMFCVLLIRTKTGRALFAVRDDEIAALLMGIDTTKYKILSFTIAAIISSISGSFLAIQLGYIDQNTFTFEMSTLILSIVILGGMGTIRGMIAGSIILIIFPEVSRFLMEYRYVIYGLILVLMMRFRPQGLLGWRDETEYPINKYLRYIKK